MFEKHFFPAEVFHLINDDVIILQKAGSVNSVNYLTIHEATAIATTKAETPPDPAGFCFWHKEVETIQPVEKINNSSK